MIMIMTMIIKILTLLNPPAPLLVQNFTSPPLRRIHSNFTYLGVVRIVERERTLIDLELGKWREI